MKYARTPRRRNRQSLKALNNTLNVNCWTQENLHSACTVHVHKKSSKEQAVVDKSVCQTLMEVQFELTEPITSSAIEHAHKALKQGTCTCTCRKLISKRQKLLRITDHLELGWNMAHVE